MGDDDRGAQVVRQGRGGRRGSGGARRPVRRGRRLRGVGAAGEGGWGGRSAPQRPAPGQHAVVVEQHEGQLRGRGGRGGQARPFPRGLAGGLGRAGRGLLAVVAAAREARRRRRGVLAEPARGVGRCGDRRRVRLPGGEGLPRAPRSTHGAIRTVQLAALRRGEKRVK